MLRARQQEDAREWARRANEHIRAARGQAQAARDRAAVAARARQLAEVQIQAEIDRRIEVAESEFEAGIQEPIDHLDERNILRWAASRNRIAQQVRAAPPVNPELVRLGELG